MSASTAQTPAEIPASRDASSAPQLSIVIPIFNEEGILHAAIVDLIDRLATAATLEPLCQSYEILLCENGSTDKTVRVANQLCQRYPQVRCESLGRPDYGAALKAGILRARGTYVMCDEIDLCDVDFYLRALPLLQSEAAELVIGSKAMSGADDRRPLLRRAATRTINGLLRLLVGFHGTDTHGLKAFRRVALLPTIRRCVVEKDLFASEFVIRAEREGCRLREIPVHIAEKRPPSINLLRRIPNVIKNLVRLAYIIRIRG